MSYLNDYSNLLLSEGGTDLSKAVSITAEDVYQNTMKNFNYMNHLICLLVGHVQSGKTSHMFAVINKAADEGFYIFILLTTDNILLQQQTYQRALHDFQGFCICDENDYIKFSQNNLKKPSIIVLKKNYRVLHQWKNDLASTNFCKGNPLFIVDDEADSRSLNTKVNQRKISMINNQLSEIKQTSSSSIFIQITATPQSILLQTEQSNWQPQYIYTFKPGSDYIGGDVFFENIPNDYLILTKDDEAGGIELDDEFPKNGLKKALFYHLITSAELFLTGNKVCNFLIHPSIKTETHEVFATKIGTYLNDLAGNIDDEITEETLRESYLNLAGTFPQIKPFDELYSCIKTILEQDEVNIYVINSKSEYTQNTQYNEGINIVIGGNSLGRGITFPMLQTIYYCRTSKTPQADTMWQHSRMFGYNRKKGLMRVFMPPLIAKLFKEINDANNILISQIGKFHNLHNVKVFYPKEIKPTRSNVLNKKELALVTGGVNYFPFNPVNKSITTLDLISEKFCDEYNIVSLNIFIKILEQIESPDNEWDSKKFISFIKSYIADNPIEQGILIVRRNRDIAKGTGTLLSPNDRLLGNKFDSKIVLTMYKVTGKKGWENKEIWIPNIKFPKGFVYYYV